MNCIYCQRHMYDGDSGVYNCLNCPSNVRYITAGSLLVPEIYYIQFYRDKYQLELNVVDQRATLCYLPFGSSNGAYVAKTIINFNEVPDVKPTTYEAWLTRILDMKAFF